MLKEYPENSEDYKIINQLVDCVNEFCKEMNKHEEMQNVFKLDILKK